MTSDSSSSDSDWIFGSNTSDDDDLLETLEHNPKRPKNEDYVEITVPLYNETEFFEHFRLRRELVEDIAHEFEQSEFYKSQTGGYGKLSAYKHVLIFLWYAGHATSSFRDVADRFDITISCLHTVVRRAMHFFSSISGTVIKWPSEQEKHTIEQHFRLKGFPGVLGAIDGTHIKIDKPEHDPDSYLNRKHFYSIHVSLNNLIFILLLYVLCAIVMSLE